MADKELLDWEKIGSFTITGHRGEKLWDKDVAPENQLPQNSFEAKEKVYKAGVLAQECDAQLCGGDEEDELYFFHDSEDDIGFSELTNINLIKDPKVLSMSDEEIKTNFFPDWNEDENKNFAEVKEAFLKARQNFIDFEKGDPKQEKHNYGSDFKWREIEPFLLSMSEPDPNGVRHVTPYRLETVRRRLERLDGMRTGPDDGYQLNIEIKRAYRFARDKDGYPIRLADDDTTTPSVKFKNGRFKVIEKDITVPLIKVLSAFLKSPDRVKNKWHENKWHENKWGENSIIFSSFDMDVLTKIKGFPIRALISELTIPRKWRLSDDEKRMEYWDQEGKKVLASRDAILPIDKLVGG